VKRLVANWQALFVSVMAVIAISICIGYMALRKQGIGAQTQIRTETEATSAAVQFLLNAQVVSDRFFDNHPVAVSAARVSGQAVWLVSWRTSESTEGGTNLVVLVHQNGILQCDRMLNGRQGYTIEGDATNFARRGFHLEKE
jgi:hypothetical protein